MQKIYEKIKLPLSIALITLLIIGISFAFYAILKGRQQSVSSATEKTYISSYGENSSVEVIVDF